MPGALGCLDDGGHRRIHRNAAEPKAGRQDIAGHLVAERERTLQQVGGLGGKGPELG